jgi:hypothetical protein
MHIHTIVRRLSVLFCALARAENPTRAVVFPVQIGAAPSVKATEDTAPQADFHHLMAYPSST